MPDDRDLSWLPQRAPVPDALPEHALWTLAKRGHRCEARTRVTPGGPELRIWVDDDLWWSHVYRNTSLLEAAADEKRADFVAKGWTLPESHG